MGHCVLNCLLYSRLRTPHDPRLRKHPRIAIVLHAVGWSLVLALLALWSLAAWALHALVGWTAANAGGVAVGNGSDRWTR